MSGFSAHAFSPIQFGSKEGVYQEFTPAKALLPYVDCYWTVDGTSLGTGGDQKLKVLPDGCVDIIYRRDPEYGYVSTMTGVMRTYMDISVRPDMRFYGIRFRPGAMRALFGVPADVFSNQILLLADLGQPWREWQHLMDGDDRDEDWVTRFNQVLLDRIYRYTNPQFPPTIANKLLYVYRHGASLAAIKDGETIFHQSWGEMSDGSPVTADTPFIIGSVSKPITSLAIMMLVEEGSIELDESINTYLPSFVYHTGHDAPITVRHLLENTSGISFSDGMKVTDQSLYGRQAIEEAVNQLSGVKLSHAPGEHYAYNSANYLLLGAIIEHVSGQTYADFVEERIFRPLGMQHAAADYDRALERGYVPGYESWLGHPVRSEGLYDDAGAPYGYITASTHDLLQFLYFMLYGGEILSEQSLEQLKAPPEEGKRYGFGWHFRTREDVVFPYHTGATPDYRAEIFFVPEQDYGAVLLTNKYHELEAVSYLSMMEGIRMIMDGDTPELAPMKHTAQWILLGIGMLLLLGAVFYGIHLFRKSILSTRSVVIFTAVFALIAVSIIPLFTSVSGIPWKTVALFTPDIAFFMQVIVGIFATCSILTIIMFSVKKYLPER